MVAVEVRSKLEQEIGVPISIVLLMGGPPISKVFFLASTMWCNFLRLLSLYLLKSRR